MTGVRNLLQCQQLARRRSQRSPPLPTPLHPSNPRITICDGGPWAKGLDLAPSRGDRSDRRQRLKREKEDFSFLFCVPDDGHNGHLLPPLVSCWHLGPRNTTCDVASQAKRLYLTPPRGDRSDRRQRLKREPVTGDRCGRWLYQHW